MKLKKKVPCARHGAGGKVTASRRSSCDFESVWRLLTGSAIRLLDAAWFSFQKLQLGCHSSERRRKFTVIERSVPRGKVEGNETVVRNIDADIGELGRGRFAIVKKTRLNECGDFGGIMRLRPSSIDDLSSLSRGAVVNCGESGCWRRVEAVEVWLVRT